MDNNSYNNTIRYNRFSENGQPLMNRFIEKCLIIFVSTLIIITDSYAGENEVSVSSHICKEIQKSANNQSAEYIPEVDVYGNHVVSAEISDPKATIADPIVIPLDINLIKRYGLEGVAGLELKPNIGWIEIYRDGKVLYNGEDIRKNIEDTCNDKDQDGQTSRDPVVSAKETKPGATAPY